MNEKSIPVAEAKIDTKSRAWKSGAIGESYVALNLGLLGLRVAQTPRGAESVDLVAINPDNGKSATIQVKSSATEVDISIGGVNAKKPDEEIPADFIVVVPVRNGKIQPVAVVPKHGGEGIQGQITREREGNKGEICVRVFTEGKKTKWALKANVYWETDAQKRKGKPHSLLTPYRRAWWRILEAVGKKPPR